MKLQELLNKLYIGTKVTVYDAGLNKIDWVDLQDHTYEYTVNTVTATKNNNVSIVLNEDIVNPDEFIEDK